MARFTIVLVCFALLLLRAESKGPPPGKGPGGDTGPGNSGGGGGKPDGGSTGGSGGGKPPPPKKPFKPTVLARYMGTVHPCKPLPFVRGSIVANVLSTEDNTTNSMTYGILISGTAEPPTVQGIYSTDPCDPLVEQKLVLDLNGTWVNTPQKPSRKNKNPPQVYTLSNTANETALPQPRPAGAPKGNAWGKVWKMQPLYVMMFVNTTAGNGTVAGKFMRNK
ncbi:unnamed protein product [Closterium sp. NIES-64]|nr:unnamed protein product [Closterium sp. NIES-64]CAI5995325.1 unnamed protein product [Closterium sp. NIES-65]